MAGWSDVGLALASGSIGVVGTLTATWLRNRQAVSDRAAGERNARIERIAEVIGLIDNLLIDLYPPRALLARTMAGDSGPEWSLLTRASNKWVPLRDSLSIAAASEPGAGVRKSLRDLGATVDSLISQLSFASQPGARVADYSRRASANHEEAKRLTEAILNTVHGEHDPDETPTPSTSAG